MPVRTRNRRTKRRATATIEFAILLPILLTIGMLCVDFGRFAHFYIAVTNSARAGAAFASVTPVTPTTKPTWDAGVKRAVEDELASNFWYDAEKLIMPEPLVFDENDLMRRVQVEVKYPFQTLITWPFLPGYEEPLILGRVVVMRVIR